MSSLTIITGTIYDAMDISGILEPIITTNVYQDPDDPDSIIEVSKPFPIYPYGPRRNFDIVQGVSAGKTFYAVHLLSIKSRPLILQDIINGGKGEASNCYANLGLAWRPENIGKPKEEWIASLIDIETFESLSNCTILLDDPSSTLGFWNSEESRAISACANAMGKLKKDIIIAAQREVQISPAIRDIATDYIVPIITRRNFTKETPRGDGYPEEMITLHFNSSKGLESVSEPITGFDNTFEAYKTVEIATGLKKDDENSARVNQPGFEMESKAFEFLKSSCPAMNWQHLNGKYVFDITSDTHAIDIVSTDPDGRLILDHKDLIKHINTAKRKGQIPYIMFLYSGEWRFVKITHYLNGCVDNKRIKPELLSKITRKGLS